MLTLVDTQYDHITEEFDLQKNILERQISGIELRQQELQLHISHIEQANNHLDLLIQQEKDKRKKGGLFNAKTRNIELLTKLYSVYREFEDTKYKYHNNISDIITKEHRLIEVDIRRIDDKVDKMTGDDMVDMFKNLSSLFGKNAQIPDVIQENIEIEGDQYNL